MRLAVVDTEDARFWRHGGVDWLAVARAAARDLERRRVVEGGSTITQQYVKNSYVSGERTLRRKLAEAGHAWGLERAQRQAGHPGGVPQHRLLRAGRLRGGGGRPDLLLDRGRPAQPDPGGAAGRDDPGPGGLRPVPPSPGGPGPAGVGPGPHGAQRPPGPGGPGQGRRRPPGPAPGRPGRPPAKARRPRPGRPGRRPSGRRGSWGGCSTSCSTRRTGASTCSGPRRKARTDGVFTGGLRITTTVDLEAQAAAERAVAAVAGRRGRDPYGALVAVEPGTGAVRAMVGGRELVGRRPVRAGEPGHRGRWRRPAGRVGVQDVRAGGGPGAWDPARGGVRGAGPAGGGAGRAAGPGLAGGQLRGPRLREGDPADGHRPVDQHRLRRAAAAAGRRRRRPRGQGGGRGGRPDGGGQPAAGGAQRGPGHRRGHAAGDGGRLRDPGRQGAAGGAVRGEPGSPGPDGRVLYQARPGADQAVQPGVAAIAADVLRGVVDRGTGVRGRIGRPAAAKTGTTQDHADAWFVGFTPSLAAAVWVGYPQGQVPMVPPRTREPGVGRDLAGGHLVRVHARRPGRRAARAVPRPDTSLVELALDLKRGCLPNRFTPAAAGRLGRLPEGVGADPDLPGAAPAGARAWCRRWSGCR